MELLLLRSLALLVLFQLLAAAVLVAGRRGRDAAAVAVLSLAIAAMMALQRSTDPGLFFASAVLSAAVVGRAVRTGVGVWRVVSAGMVPVVVASGLAFVGQDPHATAGALRAQFEALANAGAGKPPATAPGATVDSLRAGPPASPQAASPDSLAALPPEERAQREQAEELAAFAARWALRLLPAGIVGMALLQTLVVVVLAGRLVRAEGIPTAVPPVSRWQVPFGAIWGLVVGLALVALRRPLSTVIGINLAVLVGAWLAVQGFAVFLAALERSVTRAVRVTTLALAIVTMLLAWPLVACGLALLGLLDLWVDIRKLRPTPEDS